MKQKTITRQVRIPSDWLRLGIDDIMITVTASINDDGEEVNATVKQIVFPGWHCFNIKPELQFQVYEFVEQKCIDTYIEQMDWEVELYDSICHE